MDKAKTQYLQKKFGMRDKNYHLTHIPLPKTPFLQNDGTGFSLGLKSNKHSVRLEINYDNKKKGN